MKKKLQKTPKLFIPWAKDLLRNQYPAQDMIKAKADVKKPTRIAHAAKAIITILNDRGLHTRPSTEIVKLASSFSSSIQLSYQGMQVDAKSLLGLLMLAAPKGAKIKVAAEGIDAEAAVHSLVKLSEKQFNIHY